MKNVYKTVNSKLFLLFLVMFLSNLGYGQEHNELEGESKPLVITPKSETKPIQLKEVVIKTAPAKPLTSFGLVNLAGATMSTGSSIMDMSTGNEGSGSSNGTLESETNTGVSPYEQYIIEYLRSIRYREEIQYPSEVVAIPEIVVSKPPPTSQDIPCPITAGDVINAFGGSPTITTPMVNVLNKYGKLLGIDTNVELQHFLAQAAVESKNFTSTKEDTKYQTKVVMTNFGKFFNGIGHDNANPKLKNLSDFGVITTSKGIYVQNREALFNYMYNDQNRIRVGYSPIGNTQSGDGFLFIGRGVIQITGRDNYTAFNNWYKKNVDPNADLVNNPKLLDTDKTIGALASLWYFKTRVMDRLGGITNNTTADQVTKKINTKMLEHKKRASNFELAKQKIKCKN